jgi:ATP-binding cassette subfamily F protein 3
MPDFARAGSNNRPVPILAATNLRYAVGHRVLLDGLSLSIEPGERVGLVGRNGCGKTTLLRALAGVIRPDSGEVVLQRGARAGYLSQDPDLSPDRTLREEAAAAFVELSRLHAEQDRVFHQMETTPEGPEMDRLLARHASLEKQIEAAGGYATDHRIDAILHGLGFSDAQFHVHVAGLSGGQKGRLALAKLLLDGPDLLLLDEPTNHLDIAGREWLEEFLAGEFRGAVLMVSHDRYMLDRVVTRIVEVEAGRLIEYPGNYTAFTELRAERRLAMLRAYENQQTRFRQEEAYIRRYRAGQRAKQARGRATRLAREKRDAALERPVELAALRLDLPGAPRSGDLVAVVRGASKRYVLGTDPAPPHTDAEAPDAGGLVGGEKVLFRDLTVTISRGERWGIIGPNGAGKTTLVRAMLGQVPLDAGTTKIGSNVVAGYFSQMAEELDESLTVWQYLQAAIKRENPAAAAAGVSEQQARNLAGSFLFSGEDQDKPIAVLSGGERSRARLAALLAGAKNLLVLDEPTNHLDIPSAERLEEALAVPAEDAEGDGYDGTLLLISHDRALIDATCDHLLVLDGCGGVEVFHGNYSQWHDRQVQRRREAERAAVTAPSDRGSAAGAADGHQRRAKSGGGGLSWMPTERLEAEIGRLAARAAEIDALLDREDVYRDRDRCTALLEERASLTAEQARFEEEWLRRAED